MTAANWRARRRAALWEKLCSIANDLMEMTWQWEESDPEMTCWEPDDIYSATEIARRPPRTDKPRRRRLKFLISLPRCRAECV